MLFLDSFHTYGSGNVFSITLLASTRFRTCEIVKRKFVQYIFLQFLAYMQSVRKKDLFCSYTKNRQKHCKNSSIFFVHKNSSSIKLPWGYCVHSYNNTLQSRIQLTWHYRQPKEKEILDEKSLFIPF